jgi:hypothetical protein
MSDQYDFTWTDGSVPGFTVQPQTKDTESTSLVITGRGSPNWGRDLQQNLLKMLEHFASPTPPTHGVTGQLWYDTTNKVLHVFDTSADPENAWAGTAGGGGVASGDEPPTNPKPGTQWFNTADGILRIWDGTQFIQIWPQPNSVAQKVAFVEEYNSIASTINSYIGTPVGATLATAFGWGQTNTFAAETIYTMTNAKWVALLTRIKAMCTFLGLDGTGVSLDGFMYETGNTIPYGAVTMMQKYASTLAAVTAFNGPTTRFKPAASSLESTVPAQGTAARSTTWSGNITHEVLATFADTASMNAYFNSGGQVQFYSTLANAGTNRDFQWQAFLAAMGTVKFSVNGTVDSLNRANAKGLYDLTGTFSPIFAVANPSNSNQVFTVNAKIDNAKTVHFQIVFTDPGTLYGGVGGTLTSASQLVRASAAQLASPVIAYPTVTQTPLQ